MNDDLLSVIIPTYKRYPDMVNRAIQSVINQTYQNIEIIVVDDSPDDFDGRILIENMINSISNNKIRYVKNKSNMGASSARNEGIKESKGKYLAFLDDDDEWMPLKLEKQIAAMSEPCIGLVYCRYKMVNDKTKAEEIDSKKKYSGFVFDELIKENFIGSTSFVLIRRSCIEECGLFDINLMSSQDYEFWLRISKKYKVGFIDEPLVIYHVHENERISSNPTKQIQGIELLNTYYDVYLSKHKKIKSKRMMKLIPNYIEIGNIKKAIKTYIKAARLAPFNIRNNLYYLYCIFKNIIKRYILRGLFYA